MDEPVLTGEVTPAESDVGAQSSEPQGSQAPTDDQTPATGNPESSDASQEAAPVSFDADLDEWAAKTKRPVPKSDEERQLLQEIRTQQRDYSKSQAAKKAQADISQTIADAHQGIEPQQFVDPLEEKLSKMEQQFVAERNDRLRSEYVYANQVSNEEVEAMGSILQEKLDKAKAASPERARQLLDFWTDPANLADWHTLAKAQLASTSVDTTAIAEDAAKAERARIAKAQQAASVGGAAKTTVSSEKTPDEERLERFSNWD